VSEQIEKIGHHTLIRGDCREVLQGLGGFHGCATDPPYHLTSIVKRFGSSTAAPAKVGATGAFARASAGFMGQEWDGGDVAFRVETWLHVWRALRPGGHLAAFSADRTYHRMAVAIEDAGFEVRNMLAWLYGTGMPKGKAVAGFEGWNTALKPGLEPICLARKPLAEKTIARNMATYGTGAMNIEACRLEGGKTVPASASARRQVYGVLGVDRDGTSGFDPDIGRWPANVITDGSPEVYAAAGEGMRVYYCAKASTEERELGLEGIEQGPRANVHPTVKPAELMGWLLRLVVPPGGSVVEPFMGSGSTLIAAHRNGFVGTGIEQSQTYFDIACRRVEAAVREVVPKPKEAKASQAEQVSLFA
jgi:site-specific DNA-methyltransferase (adenine-specific)